MTRTLGELIWKITGDTSQFEKSAKSTSAKANELGKTGTAAFNGMKLSSIAMGIGASAAFMKVVSATKESIKVATEAQEMISKYNVVFGGMGDASEEAAKRFADAFDLAGATAKEMLSNTGNLLQGMGATKAESLALSEQVNTLASDLSSFTNNQGGAKVASEALTKALLGEREQAKTLGIAILESDVQARLAAKGQDKLEGTALKLAKAQVTLELITEQAKNSIGDYARTADSASNTQKRAAESTKELQIAVGTALNPAVTLLASVWAKVSGSLADVISQQTELSAAEKASKEGNATLEQRLLILEKEKKAIEENGRMDSVWSEESQRMIEVDSAEKLYNLSIINKRIEGVKRTQSAEQLAARTKSESDEKAAKLAAEQLAREEEIAEKYKESRDLVIGTLDGQKTEYQKIQEQIDKLQSTPWAKGELETDRLKAIEALKQKQRELLDDELKGNDEARAAAREKLASQQELINKIYALNDGEKSKSQAARESAIAEIEASSLVREQKDELIKKTNEYYDTLKKREALDTFLKNAESAFGGAADFLGGIQALQEATTSRRLELLDLELQKTLENAGVTEQTAVEKAEADYDLAVKTGTDEEKLEAQKALKKAQIEEEYAKKKAKIEYEGAMESWRLQKAIALATAAQAILAGFATVPFIPAGLAAGALATTLGGLQIAAVDQARPIPKFAEGGSFIVPPGFNNDSFPMLAQSGERVTVETPEQQRKTNGQTNAIIVLELDGQVLAESTVGIINNGKVRLKI